MIENKTKSIKIENILDQKIKIILSVKEKDWDGNGHVSKQIKPNEKTELFIGDNQFVTEIKIK